MENIRLVQNLKEVPRPCDYFDLIGGTSTGGYISLTEYALTFTKY